MVDNIELNAGTGGATLAADDIAGVWYPIQKLAFGALDTAVLAIAGAGAVTTGTQRVTLASDDPAVAALQILDNAISGTEMQVDIVASIPAGTNNIGDVDVLSLVPGTGATNLGKAIDSVGGATDTGIAALVVRDDALGALTPIEGDYVALRVDANGALWTHDDVLEAALSGSELQVDIVGALPAGANAIGKLAANTGVDIGDVDVTSVIPGTGATNLGKAIDSVGGATDTGVAALVIRDDALAALTPIEGDYVALRVDANGALWTHDDVLEAALAGSELQVDVVASLPAGTNNIGDVDVLTLPALPAGTNNIGDVDVLSIVPGTGATNLGKAEDNAHASADTGVYVLAVRDDTLGAHSGTDGDYESLHTTATGAVWATLAPTTTGGMTIFRSIDIDETEEEVKATAGVLYSISAFNRTAAPLYLKFYNATAANVIVGTTTPVLTFVVPANADSDGAGFIWNNELGFGFSTAITVACTTGVADADTGAPGANDCIINLGYA